MRIYDLKNIDKEALNFVGGKARGLFHLSETSINVSPGFVITKIKDDKDIEEAADYWEESGLGCVAVRSSATSEDGTDFSSAGQYSTFLEVDSREKFIEAVKACLVSLNNVTAQSYSNFFAQAQSREMNIVIQKMVFSKYAGVCFTINPITQNKNQVLIEAVEGLGEKLVSGSSKSRQYIMDKDKIIDDSLMEKDIEGFEPDNMTLTFALIKEIAKKSIIAEKFFKTPIDTEWAVNFEHEVLWLQARPITTVEEIPLDELDTKELPTDMLTTCNIGEMLPNAVTPLSLSTSVFAIDYGMRKMLTKTGVAKKPEDLEDFTCVGCYSGHLFLNFRHLYRMAVYVVGASKDAVEISLCGKGLDNIPGYSGKKPRLLKRMSNGVKYFRYILSRNKARKSLGTLAESFHIPLADNPITLYKSIDQSLKVLNQATFYHYTTSSHSGAMSGALFTILSKDIENKEEVKGIIAGVLEDIDDIESVDILRSLRKLASELLKVNPQIGSYSTIDLANYVKSSTGESRKAYDYFMKRHGHRAIREAELRSTSWANDEEGLMKYLSTVINTGGLEPVKLASQYKKNRAALLARYRFIKKKALSYIIDQSRAGCVNREYSKSMFIKVIDQFKIAYRSLAKQLVADSSLPDEDLVFFLTHQELAILIKEKSPALIKRALSRRRNLEEQNSIKFAEINVGKPLAIIPDFVEAEAGAILSGAPISRGKAVGKARVVRSIEDANKLEKGEIMVAGFTDIGWSPFYCLISGLITEVGSALSHGAVVAREYALPLVANIAFATDIIKTGDLISMDGYSGKITILESSKSSVL